MASDTGTQNDQPVKVTPDNFIRAESDLYFGHIVSDNGFGHFKHNRELTPLDNQMVIRQNRDTLYSAAVFDIDAGPVTVTTPDPGARFMSVQVITEDHYVPEVVYGTARRTFTRDAIGTRYVVLAVRILVDPSDPADLEAVHALQDAITVEQDQPGTFEIPAWDAASQKLVRDALVQLATTLPDTKGMFGTKETTDPVRRLIGAANAWGGNPERDALYLTVVPALNDGTAVYRLTLSDVPVDGFWSVTVYNEDGYFTPNARNAYSLNDITAKKADDGSVTIQFGGCDGSSLNCLPVTPGWNYIVRLYRPQQSILDGEWTFPEATPSR
jgi:hypothetical protein